MTTDSLYIKTHKISNFTAIFKNDIVFTASLCLALASCLISIPDASYINFKVIICLFNLMIVIKAFDELKLLERFANGILNSCTNSRSVSMILIALSFFASMLITNDIALITLVPITLIISKKSEMDILTTVILETLAANIGSSLTPMGNPQNLFIFSYYHLTALEFFTPVMFFAVSGFLWLCVLNYKSKNSDINICLKEIKIKSKSKTLVWILLFLIIILSVFGIVNYILALFLTLLITLVIDRKLILKVDYILLLTFVCFFIFIGNISHVKYVESFMRSTLGSGSSTYFSSILLSQFISNVPCSVFLSRFTSNWHQLLLGVNIGGMGTIIASLASIISYKLFVKENPSSGKKYLYKFSIYNILSLAVFTIFNYFVLIRT